ncbi:MAG: MFS transporter [Anaerolineales bacterium]|nr:MFS transporter [Anaerolineales bacterium]
MSRWSGYYADKFGPRMPMIVGPAVIGVGFFMYMIPGESANYWLTFLPATIVYGIGLGITVAPLTTVALGAAPMHLSGLASGVSNAASRIASMLAVATLGFLMVLQFSASLEHRTQSLPLSEQERVLLQDEKLKLGGASAPPDLTPAVRTQVDTAIDEAFVDAFRLMMALCGVLALISAGVSALTITNQITHHEDGHQPPHFEIMG